MATAMLVGCSSHTEGNMVPSIGGNADASPHHHTFRFTGTKQTFKVPSGVNSITVDARGAAGAPFPYGGRYVHKGHGRGGRARAIIPVSPGETLYVFVGGEGSGGIGGTSGGTGFNGGAGGGLYPYCGRSGYKCYGSGGGGASDVRENVQLKNRIIVAAGGGGAGTGGVFGGGGGGKIGASGGSGSPSGYYAGGGGGGGGTQYQGGSGGAGQYGGSYGNGGPGSPGTLGQGGSGGQAGDSRYCSSSCNAGAGGGGGGGYYGGGGGGGACSPSFSSPECGVGGGGGGGSSYVEPSATNVKIQRNFTEATGNGLVILSWQ